MKNFRNVDCVPAKKNALYLSVNVFSRKILLIGDTIFTRDRHFTWSSEPREGAGTVSPDNKLTLTIKNTTVLMLLTLSLSVKSTNSCHVLFC